jgi:hypothetical protein
LHLPGSFDSECGEARNRFRFELLDIIHSGCAWAGLEPRAKAEKLIARTKAENLNTPIGVIAHPTSNAEDARLAFHKPTKADALHAPANHEAAGVSSLLGHAVSSLGSDGT